VPGAFTWFVVIKADKDVSYGTMGSIMDALQAIKISKFSLVTEMEMEKGGAT
jgi:biopolymer transport protein ExbD